MDILFLLCASIEFIGGWVCNSAALVALSWHTLFAAPLTGIRGGRIAHVGALVLLALTTVLAVGGTGIPHATALWVCGGTAVLKAFARPGGRTWAATAGCIAAVAGSLCGLPWAQVASAVLTFCTTVL